MTLSAEEKRLLVIIFLGRGWGGWTGLNHLWQHSVVGDGGAALSRALGALLDGGLAEYNHALEVCRLTPAGRKLL